MKVKRYLNKGLSKKYATLMGIFIGIYLIGAVILGLSLEYFKENYSNQNELLEKKESLAQEINTSFNLAFADARGYFAYGNIRLKESALAQSEKVLVLQQRFAKITSTEKDERFLRDTGNFTRYYFDEALPNAISNYEQGSLEEVAKLANTSITAKVTRFQGDSRKYINDLGVILEDSFERLIRLQTNVQIAFVVFILLILLTLLHITRIILAQQDELQSKSIQIKKLYDRSSELVSTVSHELRTPLASILGFTELLIHRDLKRERQQKYLQTIYNETKRLTALINDFLDIQRMEAGQQTYEKKFLELKPILEKVIEVQEVNLIHHHILLKNEGRKGLVLGDPEKLEQVFTNIIHNAIKYSPNGGDIEIMLYQQDEQIHVDVKDEGLGIPKESLQNLFTKFYRVDNSDRRSIGGTGLGLAIVQEIMLAHNGEVSVISEYGKGSTFTCAFPVVPAQSVIESIGVPNEYDHKVMIIEDDLSLGQLICQELKDSGFQVTLYTKGLEALSELNNEIPDCIVLDILLEKDEIDGWRILEEVKRKEKLKNIPIIISTALDEKEKGYSLGATNYLIKPYKPSHLTKTIKEVLAKNDKAGLVYIPIDE
jgi:signal transduction histidine kinase/ActR/RegA family two-component response regulator